MLACRTSPIERFGRFLAPQAKCGYEGVLLAQPSSLMRAAVRGVGGGVRLVGSGRGRGALAGWDRGEEAKSMDRSDARGALIGLLKREALRTGTFTLASGRTSHY